MAFKGLAAALSLAAAVSPVSATVHDPDRPAIAPPGTPETRYCMRIEAITGSRLEEIKCWTRAEWAERGVDVDQDWAKEGVSVKG